MSKPPLTRKRIIAAYVVAIIADILEIPITATEDLSGMALLLPAEAADGIIDCVVMGLMTKLLGFHWAFLPTFIIELIPEVDLLPTWVGCVALVVWQRKKEVPPAAPREVIDVTPRTPPVPPMLHSETLQPPPIEIPGANPMEERLRTLSSLREKNLISQEEHDAKRRQILSGL